MTDFIRELRSTVDAAATALLTVSPAACASRPAGGGWSPKEVIGHLIDSAANNHLRFVRASRQDDLVFAGYEQDEWVAVQQYQAAPWVELVTLWRDYNRHIARLMAATPLEVRQREHRRHNLHQVAWQPVPADQPATLEYFMRDYVGHLQHHLRQIDRLLGRAPKS